MTPKEKALDLIDKINNMPITLKDWLNASDYAKSELKRKALIVVDEILSLYTDDDVKLDYKYWNEVKTEIENL